MCEWGCGGMGGCMCACVCDVRERMCCAYTGHVCCAVRMRDIFAVLCETYVLCVCAVRGMGGCMGAMRMCCACAYVLCCTIGCTCTIQNHFAWRGERPGGLRVRELGVTSRQLVLTLRPPLPLPALCEG